MSVAWHCPRCGHVCTSENCSRCGRAVRLVGGSGEAPAEPRSRHWAREGFGLIRLRPLIFGLLLLTGTLLMQTPSAAAAARTGLSVSVTATADRVTANGSVAIGIAREGSLTVLLERQLGRRPVREVVVARGRCRSANGVNSFSLFWKAPASASTIRVRVIVVSRGTSVAESSVRRVSVRPPVVVQSRLRRGTVELSPRQVAAVSDGHGGWTTVLLARGVPAPRGGASVIIPVSLRAPRGVLGVVGSVRRERSGRTLVVTRPASLQTAYSSFNVRVDDTLGDLSATGAIASAASADSGSESGSGTDESARFDCSGSADHPFTANVDLSQMRLLLDINANVYSPSVQFILEGSPKFTFTYGVSGAVTCTADAPGPPIPLGDTGLFLTMGPHFSFTAAGSIMANLTWSPYIGVTFFRSRRSGNSQSYSFRDGGSASVTGSANASLGLGLATTVSIGEGDAEIAGITGTVGPEIAATVSADTGTGQTCFNVDASAEVDLTASAHVLFRDWEYDIGSATFGDVGLYRHCTSGSGGSGGSGGGGGATGGGGTGVGGGNDGFGLVSCVSTSLCRAVWGQEPDGPAYNAYTDTNGQWSGPQALALAQPPSLLEGLSCAPTGFCMALDEDGEGVATSGDGWKSIPSTGDGVPYSVSCTSASFCVAVGLNGDAVIYDGSSWGMPVRLVDAPDQMGSVSCTSSAFCVATDVDGRAMTYNGSSWSAPETIDPAGSSQNINSRVSCASSSFCVALATDGNAEVYNGASWSPPSSVSAGNLSSVSVSCATATSFCGVTDSNGEAYTYQSGIWSEPITVDSGSSLSSVSCSSTTSCVAIDTAGRALTYNGTSWATSSFAG